VSIPGQSELQSDHPVSAHSVIFIEGEQGTIYFDFTDVRQREAGFECISTTLIIVVIVVTSWDLSRVLHTMLLKPFDNMIMTMRKATSAIRGQRGSIDIMDVDGELETEELQKEVARCAEVLKNNCQIQHLTEDEVAKLAPEQLGYREMGLDLDDIAETTCPSERKMGEMRPTTMTVNTRTTYASTMRLSIGDDLGEEILDCIETSSFNVLEMSNQDVCSSIAHLFFGSSVANVAFNHNVWSDPVTFQCFITEVQSNYNKLPYHNFLHAVDILQTVFQFLKVTESVRWMSNIDQYALMIAALGHDMGHEGFTNEFLKSTGHPWAERYNDRSPLENMHCSKLFEICGKEECKNIFGRCTPEDKKEARKVVINCILHTDMAHHGEMVKEIKNFYLGRKEVCDHQALLPNGFTSNYEKEVLHEKKQQWLQLFLHMADVSNPIKPWSMCEPWADRVLEEFFNEGDEQKSLGIPVGHLNDRDIVHRPSSQHAFITFLVQPLLAGTANLFPTFAPFYLALATNLEEWFQVWVAEANPTAEELAKRERKVKEVLDEAKEFQLDAKQRHDTPASRKSRWMT